MKYSNHLAYLLLNCCGIKATIKIKMKKKILRYVKVYLWDSFTKEKFLQYFNFSDILTSNTCDVNETKFEIITKCPLFAFWSQVGECVILVSKYTDKLVTYGGLSHFLCLNWTPVPQVLLHKLHWLHGLQSPSTCWGMGVLLTHSPALHHWQKHIKMFSQILYS